MIVNCCECSMLVVQVTVFDLVALNTVCNFLAVCYFAGHNFYPGDRCWCCGLCLQRKSMLKFN